MEFDYFNYKSNNKVQKGSIIFSQPLMKDKNFYRSVILICEHNDGGSLGYKLNEKIASINIQTSLDKLIIDNLYNGGPVDHNYLNFIHNFDGVVGDKLAIDNNLFLGGDIDNVIYLSKKKHEILKFKFFLGYSGWEPKQLEDEINDNSWIVINEYDSDFIFKDINERFWSKFLSKNGGKNKIFSNYPSDPSLN